MSSLGILNPYDLHKRLINEYILKRPGDTATLYQRDTSRDRTDTDVLRDNHKFLWGPDDQSDTWEKQLAKRYYDKLFKEYCICDLSRYKENKVALRWRIEREVIDGKGQFICGTKHCDERIGLRSWEVNFGYQEDGLKKNVLIKLRLCPNCSTKLNYHSKKREVKSRKRLKRKSYRIRGGETNEPDVSTSSKSNDSEDIDKDSEIVPKATDVKILETQCWNRPVEIEDKSREQEFDEYLEDLLL